MHRTATAAPVFLAVLLVIALLSGWVFAKGFERPPGEPPFGTAVQQDAPGVKLSGQIIMGLVNVSPTADVFVLLSLQKGSQPTEKFYAEILGVPDALDPAIVQLAITNVLAPQILQRFFPGQTGLSVRLKSMTGFQDFALNSCIFSHFRNCFINVADVTVAVQ